MFRSSFQPNHRPRNPNQRRLALCILLVLFLALGGYFAFQKYLFWKNHRLSPNLRPTELEKNLITPEEQARQTETKKELDPDIDSSDWKTFADKTVNFTFKYPAVVAHPQKSDETCPLTVHHDPKAKTVVLTFACLYPKLTDWQTAQTKNSNSPLGILIHYAATNNEKDLSVLAEKTFGTDCPLGPASTYAHQAEVKKMEIAPEAKNCPTRSPHILLFSSAAKTALALKQPDTTQFLSASSETEKKLISLDDKIIGSIRLK